MNHVNPAVPTCTLMLIPDGERSCILRFNSLTYDAQPYAQWEHISFLLISVFRSWNYFFVTWCVWSAIIVLSQTCLRTAKDWPFAGQRKDRLILFYHNIASSIYFSYYMAGCRLCAVLVVFRHQNGSISGVLKRKIRKWCCFLLRKISSRCHHWVPMWWAFKI